MLIFLQNLLVEISVLNSNEKIHEDMVMGIVRSPLGYFDMTPSGQITNKFSNDLGILDNLLALTLIFVLEKMMIWIVMLGSSFSMNLIYMIPAAGCLAFFIAFFNYSKQAIIATKELSLLLKSPVFSQLREMMRGLIPLHQFNQLHNYTAKFIESLNASLDGAICFISLERVFGITIEYGTITLLVIGMELGAATIDKDNPILFGVQVLYFSRMIQVIQTLLRQIITMQGLMISAERSFEIVSLPQEKELETSYDEEHGINNKWSKGRDMELKNLSLRYQE